MKKLIAFLLIPCALLAALAFLAVRLAPGDDSLSRVSGTNYLGIGYSIEAPFAYLTPGGEVTGHSPELARRIAGRLGIANIRWRVADFGELITELNEHRIDVIAAGMCITPERARLVSFSEPIFHIAQGMLVAAGNPHGLHSYSDAVSQPGAMVAVLSGAVEEALLLRLGLPENRLVRVPDAQTGRTAVESGIAHGLALSSPTIQWLARQDHLGRTEPASPFAQPDPRLAGHAGHGAFAFRKDDRKLLNAWNAVLADVVRGQEYLDLMTAYGFTREELPGNASTKELLTP